MKAILVALIGLAAGLKMAEQEQPSDSNYEELFGPFRPMKLTDGKRSWDIEVQYAKTDKQQHQGLMYRKKLGDNQGMIFEYDQPGKRVLYMRNTYVPLDAGWFQDDGTLAEVDKLQPLDETWVWTDSTKVKTGLEMNQGWFEKNGVKPGEVYIDADSFAKVKAMS